MNGIDDVLAAWTAAEEQGDTAALERLLAGGFTAVGPLGFTLSRDDWLERHRTGSLTYETFGLDETTVRVHGDCAIVTGRQHATGAWRGNPVPEALRSTLVLVGGRIEALHMSFVAGTPGAPPIPGAPRPS
ncbi:nuclear transport factor 2 family protein [Nonomuraea sp. NPDC048826]|uniref:nuclear transport factor 2 family protein n=1 Tax=Nonomuraea sp. NPDC048826 TaxID=3364347 RepID=UPI00371024B8